MQLTLTNQCNYILNVIADWKTLVFNYHVYTKSFKFCSTSVSMSLLKAAVTQKEKKWNEWIFDINHGCNTVCYNHYVYQWWCDLNRLRFTQLTFEQSAVHGAQRGQKILALTSVSSCGVHCCKLMCPIHWHKTGGVQWAFSVFKSNYKWISVRRDCLQKRKKWK